MAAVLEAAAIGVVPPEAAAIGVADLEAAEFVVACCLALVWASCYFKHSAWVWASCYFDRPHSYLVVKALVEVVALVCSC